MAHTHRAERGQLGYAQTARQWDETAHRAARFRRGLAGLWDTVTGRKRHIRAENEAQHIASLKRDAAERDALVEQQITQRRPCQADLDRTRKRHIEERRLLARQIADHRQRLRRANDRRDLERGVGRGLSRDERELVVADAVRRGRKPTRAEQRRLLAAEASARKRKSPVAPARQLEPIPTPTPRWRGPSLDL